VALGFRNNGHHEKKRIQRYYPNPIEAEGIQDEQTQFLQGAKQIFLL
jgi:hypothetical protein